MFIVGGGNFFVVCVIVSVLGGSLISRELLVLVFWLVIVGCR